MKAFKSTRPLDSVRTRNKAKHPDKNIYFFNGLKLLPIGLMFGMLVPLSSTYSISPRIDNNNFHLGFLREKERRKMGLKKERDLTVYGCHQLQMRDREKLLLLD